MGISIKTEQICREFKVGGGTVHALTNVSIDIQPNTLTILKGRSGSGKTTLINILGTLDRPTSGKVYYDGKDITGLSDRARDGLRRHSVGFVFQSVALISTMSAYENVDFSLRIAGYPKSRRDARVRECLTMVGLEKRMFHKPAELSGGEQQRVAVARAIAHSPGIIFADEPTAELDTAISYQIVDLFRNIAHRDGITIVMTTHDPSMLSAADKIYTLEDGETVDE